ncbi:hypothetical protein [Streptomyces sp. UNOB3_S3]|uniref:hypothetical protein n=1 Tax=Streptomyces sp. UNOB3_S3 TaxID=2871682 RepID=UPI001E63B803|nr:hypothetical protein [Streptomyces sp. UNOB3_S3]MCC3779888.1 hypothetical protein [Streptomyces sp. UNOB3_S3]
MSTGQSRGRALAQLMAVCAVLLGLFLMHGSPASAATGCHGAMQEHVATPASPVVPTGHAAHRAHETAAGMTPAATAHSPVHVDAQGMTGEHGTLCVATAPRDRLPLPTIWLLAAVVLAGPAGWALVRRCLVAGSVGRRGPPGHGRALLLRKCVARN